MPCLKNLRVCTVAVALGITPIANVTVNAQTTMAMGADNMTVEGPEVSVTADWNQNKDASGIYTAPPGWKIRQIVVQEISNANGGSFRTEIVGNQARVHASAHGSGKFFDQYRGWIHVKSTVILEKVAS